MLMRPHFAPANLHVEIPSRHAGTERILQRKRDKVLMTDDSMKRRPTRPFGPLIGTCSVKNEKPTHVSPVHETQTLYSGIHDSGHAPIGEEPRPLFLFNFPSYREKPESHRIVQDRTIPRLAAPHNAAWIGAGTLNLSRPVSDPPQNATTMAYV